MSDYEIVNQMVAARKAARRRDALRRFRFSQLGVLAVLVILLALEYIGFINTTFMLILGIITISAGSFNAGYIWRSYRR